MGRATRCPAPKRRRTARPDRDPLEELEHQVAADEARPVGAAVRPVRARRGQQQARRPERAGRDDEVLRPESQDLAAPHGLHVRDLLRGAPQRPDLAAVDHRGAAGGQRRLHPGRPPVHLAAAGTSAAEALGAAGKIPDADVLAVWMQPGLGQGSHHRRVARGHRRRRRAATGARSSESGSASPQTASSSSAASK